MTSPRPAPFGRRVVLAAFLLCGGCAVGPDFQRPGLPDPRAGYAKGAPEIHASRGVAQEVQLGGEVDGQWWTLFQSQGLNRLVEAALKANPDLEAAQAALRSAHAMYLAQRGALLPMADLGGSASREKASGALSPPLSTSQLQFNLYNAQVNVGFTPDVFGGLRRQVEAAAAQEEAQRFAAEATYLTLTANVVTAAIQAAGLEAQIRAARTAVKYESDVLDLIRRQAQLGQSGGGDVAAQEALLAQTEQILPPLTKQLRQALDQLAALTGRSPADALDVAVDLEGLVLPTSLPVSLPAKLVDQRPDVRIAAANLHAASAAVGVAIAARLPAIALTASYGGSSTAIGQILTQPNSLWVLGAGITQPIFAGGALRYKQKAAEASLDQAKAQYRSAVNTALQNVADSLGALAADADAEAAADRAEAAAGRSLAIARRQLEIGDASRVTLLTAEQSYAQTLVAKASARANRLADVVALFQASGGGWWNRRDF